MTQRRDQANSDLQSITLGILWELALKQIIQYVGYTCTLFCAGVIALAISLASVPKNGSASALLLISILVSTIFLLASPVIAGAFLWYKHKRYKIKLGIENAVLSRKATETAAQVAEMEALKRRFYERERLIDCVDSHRVALSRNLARAIRKNDYGAVIDDRRGQALREFFATIDLEHISS